MADASLAPASSWERLLELGRLEEKNGRAGRADRAYRRALAANPAFAPLEREYARFLESRRRAPEAEARLLRAMELGWTRDEGERTLARLRAKRSARALAEDRRFAEAARALAAEPASAEGDALCAKVFSALLCEGEYGAAFRLADAMLRKSSQAPFAHKALWPWWHAVSSRGSASKAAFCAAELARVRKAAAGGRHAGWFAYLRGVLLLSLNRGAEARAEHERVKRLRAPRYAPLRYPFALHRLGLRDFAGAAAELAGMLEAAPGHWWLRCRRGEALMAGGGLEEGLAEFARAEADAPPEDKPAVMTWHGGALLWAGRYPRSLEKLDAALGAGADLWVRCWRGGANLMLGRRREALSDLDRALAADPQDLEAHLWRGEALRRLGRTAEALRALDRALALDPKYAWARVHRALARADAGDAKGLAADFARVPAEIVAAARAKASPRKRGALAPKEMHAILEAALRLAKGVRRPERCMDSIWLGTRRG